MLQSRTSAAAALLPSGDVLVSGGSDGSAASSSAELYDPATGTWRATGSMTEARYSHVAVTLSDGRVLVVGGQPTGSGNDTVGSSTDIYTPSTGTWQAVPSMSYPHTSPFVATLKDGAVMVAGGSRTEINDDPIASGSLAVSPGGPTEIFDPATSTWHTSGPMVVNDLNGTAVVLPDGRVFAGCGGVPGDFEIYTPVANPAVAPYGVWRMTTPALAAVSSCAMSLLPDGRILVAGGNDWVDGGTPTVATSKAMIYDPAADSWSLVLSLHTPRAGGTATTLPDGRVLITGGTGANFVPVTSTEIFDEANGGWVSASSTPTLQLGRICCETTTLLSDGRVLIAGGAVQASNATAEAEVVQP